MGDYYQECLKKIETLLAQGHFQEAQTLILEELRMPYIPMAFEQRLYECLKDIPNDKSGTPQYFQDIDSCVNALSGPDEVVDKALASLAQMNCRAYLETLEHCLTGAYDDYIKQAILFILMEQEIDKNIDVVLQGIGQSLNPVRLENPLISKGYLKALELIKAQFEQEDPTFAMICEQLLSEKVISDFPRTVSDDQAHNLMVEVVGEVMKSMGQDEQWQNFKKSQRMN